MMLLTDGRVMMQGAGASKNWYQLTPTATGTYVDGTWSTLASMGTERLYYGSNVLPNGNVFVLGGEYSGSAGTQNFNNTGEIYDSVANTWSPTANFPMSQFGDDPTALLGNGSILCGFISGPQTFLYNPTTNTFSSAGTKLLNDQSDEETWVMLPDGSILSYDIFASISSGANHAQRYIPSTNTWVDAGTFPAPLITSSATGFEMGPALLLPDGRVFQVGSNGNTALYTPSTNSWVLGPAIPGGKGADDAPGAMLPNGHVIFAADTTSPSFTPPTQLFDFDPVANTITQVALPAALASTLNSNPAFVTRMLMLPNGDLLFGGGFNTSSNQLWEYTPDGAPAPSWQPTISSTVLNSDGSFTLTGTQLNGISEGASYGDDAEMSTNYPIVQLTAGDGTVTFGRTFNWTPQVATGATPVTTQFSFANVPAAGTYSLRVIANGIASAPATFIEPLTVSQTNPANGAVVSTALTSFVVNFNEAVDPSTVQPGDFLVNGVAATGVTLNGANTAATFTFTTSPITAQGVQTMAVASSAITGVDGSGNTAFNATFRYDAITLAVSTTSPATSSTITIPPNGFTYDVNFNEAIDPATAAASNLTLSQGSVSNVSVLAGNQTIRYTLTGITQEGTLTVTLPAGKVKDAFDNPAFTPFTGTYSIDFGIVPFTTPLASVQPLGSLVYSNSMAGLINTGTDTDSFTLNVDAGQTITVIMHVTSATLQPTVTLDNPSSTVLATATGSAANVDAILETIPATTSGVYTIVAGSAAATSGNYTIQVVLNSAEELERHASQPINSSLATGQNLDAAFVALQSSPLNASRAAVTGTTDGTPAYTAAAVTPAFTDISTTGNLSAGAVGDNAADTLSSAQLAGFTFPFYNVVYNSLSFSTNGLISFTTTDTASTNTDLSASPVEAVIAPLWDDLVIDNSGSGSASRNVFWQVTGSGASQQLIIQWNNARQVNTSTFFTFEAVLSVDGTIQFNYAASVPSAAISSATVGVKGAGGINPQRLLVSFNQAPGVLVGAGLSTQLSLAVVTTVFSTDFSSGTSGFVVNNSGGGLWHLSTGRGSQGGHSASNSFYYGQGEGASGGGNYNTAGRNTGTLTSPSIALPTVSNGESLLLDFNYVLQTEVFDGFDVAQVQISTNGGSTFTTLATYNVVAESSSWRLSSPVDLSSFAGQSVQVRWSFDTVDSFNNNFEGWYVDDVRIQKLRPTTDYYAFSLAAGDTATLFLQSLTTPPVYVSLQNAAGTTLAQGVGSTPAQNLITDFMAPSAGVYYAVVAGAASTNYNLVITKNAEFSKESNDTLATAQSVLSRQVGGEQQVLGYIGSSDVDIYKITLGGSAALVAQTSTPADGSGEFVNTLDPRLLLFDAGGTLVASNDNSAPDGRNALLNFTAPAGTGGTYYIEVAASTASTTTGEYVLRFNITNPATHFTVSGPASRTAGATASVIVTALDQFNNSVPSYTGTVHFTSSDLQAGLPGDYPFVAGDSGVHTFSVTFKTTGNQTVTVTDTTASFPVTGVSGQVAVVAPIGVQGVQINDGSSQRSMVTSITVTFSTAVGTVDDGAFQVTRQSGGDPTVVVSWNVAHTAATLTFTGAQIIGGSLQDGNYSLVMDSTKIHDATGGLLDGDGDGLSGGARAADTFFRLFGDSDGDRDVDNLDLFHFRQAFGSASADANYKAYFDYDSDGDVDNLDLFHFRQRFGTTLAP
jgi:hypothetical protein